MTALSKIKSAGFQLSLTNSGDLQIMPASKLTQSQREFLKAHKAEIVSLLSANDEKNLLSDLEMAGLLREASEGISIEPERLWSFLDSDDVDDLRRGLIDLETLRAYAESWLRYAETVPICNDKSFSSLEIFEPVQCADCAHFTPDTVGDGTGIGRCNVSAKTKGSLYPNRQRCCDSFKQR